MAIQLSESVRHTIINNIKSAIDGGSGAGYIQIRSGTRPANVSGTATGTLLVTLTLNKPSYGAPSAGTASISLSPAVAGTAVANGTATWARVFDSAGVAVMDCSVGTTGADFLLSSTNILTGATITLTAGSITMPA